jgi:hypothetical protein
MISEITSAIGSAKVAFDMAKGMAALKNQVDVQMKAAELLNVIIDLQGKLQEAQAATAAIQAELREVRTQQRELEDWAAEKSHYRLHRFEPGGIVYRYHATSEDDAPPHDLCADCYHKNVKSILQATAPVGSHRALKCHGCSSVVLTERIESGGVWVVPTSRGQWHDY